MLNKPFNEDAFNFVQERDRHIRQVKLLEYKPLPPIEEFICPSQKAFINGLPAEFMLPKGAIGFTNIGVLIPMKPLPDGRLPISFDPPLHSRTTEIIKVQTQGGEEILIKKRRRKKAELTPDQKEILAILFNNESARLVPNTMNRSAARKRTYMIRDVFGNTIKAGVHWIIVKNLINKNRLRRLVDGGVVCYAPIWENVSGLDGKVVVEKGLVLDEFLTFSSANQVQPSYEDLLQAKLEKVRQQLSQTDDF